MLFKSFIRKNLVNKVLRRYSLIRRTYRNQFIFVGIIVGTLTLLAVGGATASLIGKQLGRTNAEVLPAVVEPESSAPSPTPTTIARSVAAVDCTVDTDHGGAAWDPATDCLNSEIAGAHTNVGALTISVGQTVVVKGYNGSTYGSVSINATSADIQGTLTATGKGYRGQAGAPGEGPGGGGALCGSDSGGGAGFASAGGPGLYGVTGGAFYGNALAPTQMGSAGGAGGNCGVGFSGGNGGGAIRLTTSGTLTVSGTIATNGSGGAGSRPGGGSGGSIYLTANTFAGAGALQAVGQNGSTSGNGAGGRIAVHYTSKTFSGTFNVNSGSGGYGGGPGSMVYVDTANNDLIIPSSQTWYADPAMDGGTFNYHAVTVQNNSIWSLKGHYTTNSNGSGFVFNVTDFDINSGSTVSGDGLGYLGNATTKKGDGPGGGGTICPSGDSGGGGAYGGTGGAALYGDPGGVVYGSHIAPVDLGSAGGTDGCANAGGGGGSAIKIIATGAVTITGILSMNGTTTVNRAGGGSGGSIWIITPTLAGSGTIQANGSNGGAGLGGGGGGGRIAVFYATTNSFSGTLTANGGTGYNVGGNGTVIVVDSTNNDLYISNSQTWHASPSLEGSVHTYNSITVQNNASWTLPGYYTNDTDGIGFVFNVTNFNVTTGSSLNSDRGGYAGGTSAHRFGYGQAGGEGKCSEDSAGGGGHAGVGGVGLYSAAGGTAIYGQVKTPLTLGSGGGVGSNCSATHPGGEGGGAVKINASGTVTINGSISANGGAGTAGRSGGGAGGSILIISSSLAGNGSVTANGGSGTLAGSGGGGRIAVYYSTGNSFSGTLTVNPGSSTGTAGTLGSSILIDSANNDLYIKTTQVWNADPALEGSNHSYHNINVQNNSTLTLKGYYTSNTNGTGFNFSTTNFTVETGSSVTANGQGYAGGTPSSKNGSGSGGGTACPSDRGGGGGYGGAGGNGLYGELGGSVYGSFYAPTDLGSGGGAGNCSTGGGNGGGAIHISATEILTVNGNLTADGNAGIAQGGGGSGGSIYLQVGSISGNGNITAKGGGGNNSGGNGAGGRIAIFYTSLASYTGTTSVSAGAGGLGGENGSAILVDSTNNDLYIQTSQTWLASPAEPKYSFRNMYVQSNSTLNLKGYSTTDTNGKGFYFDVTNFTLDAGSTLFMDGFGYSGGTSSSPNGKGRGAGQALCGEDSAGGAAHGGAGGNGLYTAIGGAVYENEYAPVDLGSGGGVGSNCSASHPGGAGGGALRVKATGTITVNGTITANGLNGSAGRSGGGAGGSVFLIGGTLSGNGTVRANGGNATLAGNGGGGMVMMCYISTNSYSGTMLVNSGTGGIGGANGTSHISLCNAPTLSNLQQYKYNGTSTIPVNGNLPGTTGKLGALLTDQDMGDILSFELEVRPVGTAFTNVATVTDSDIPSGINIDQRTLLTGLAMSTGYHWQARAIDSRELASAWVAFGGNAESQADLTTSIPQIAFTTTSSSGSESASPVNLQVSVSDTSDLAVSVQVSATGGTAMGGGSDYALSQSSVSIPPGSQSVDVPLSVINDAIDEDDENVVISLGSPTNATLGGNVSHDYSIQDNDVAGIQISESDNTTNITEAGTTDTFTVQLMSQPLNTVTITVQPDAQINVTSAILTFTTGNWNIPQTVTINAVDDAFAEGPHTGSISLVTTSSDPKYVGSVSDVIIAQIIDNETAGIVVTESSGSTYVTEGGTGDTYSVALINKPTSNVVILLTTSSHIHVSGATLTFTPSNWNVPQDVPVTAVDDNQAEGNHSGTVTYVVQSTNSVYNNAVLSPTTVNVVDNDSAGVSVVETSGSTSVKEAGAGDTFSIVLTSQPTANVTINAGVQSPVVLSASVLTFTSENWNQPQSITVTTLDDSTVQGNRSRDITFAVHSDDSSFNNISIAKIGVIIVDNDTVAPQTPSEPLTTDPATQVTPTITVTPTEIPTPTEEPTATPSPIIQQNKNTVSVGTGDYDLKITVVDENGVPVKGAVVKVGSLNKEAVTDDAGVAIFKEVAQGDYKVLVAYEGKRLEQKVVLADSTITNSQASGSKTFDYTVHLTPKESTMTSVLLEKAGPLGLASVALISVLSFAELLPLIREFIAGGFLLPFLSGLVSGRKKKSGRVVSDISKESLAFARIVVTEATSGVVYKKIVTNLNGKFVLKLVPGQYRIQVIRHGYQTLQIMVPWSESGYFEETLELMDEPSYSIAQMTVKVQTFDPKIIMFGFSLVLALINVAVLRTLLSVVIFIIIALFSIFFIKNFSKLKWEKKTA